MTIVEPDWINGLIGGLIIGLAGAVFLLGNGRVMGASGILGSTVDGSARRQLIENLAFILGLIGVPAALIAMGYIKSTNATENTLVLAAAGLCVGIGTRIANGCTSGHGVCGISRFSVRGIVATVFYIMAGGIAVYAFRHMLGWI
jgi:uncharacterized membrane protein YedE/YeeE